MRIQIQEKFENAVYSIHGRHGAKFIDCEIYMSKLTLFHSEQKKPAYCGLFYDRHFSISWHSLALVPPAEMCG